MTKTFKSNLAICIFIYSSVILLGCSDIDPIQVESNMDLDFSDL